MNTHETKTSHSSRVSAKGEAPATSQLWIYLPAEAPVTMAVIPARLREEVHRRAAPSSTILNTIFTISTIVLSTMVGARV